MTLDPVLPGCASAGRAGGCGCAERAPFYPTDLPDQQWAALEPALPVMLCDTQLGGRPEKHHRRAMISAIFYVTDNGIKWPTPPRDFPP